ncbi:MAG TPA: protein kinase [Gemmatimonadales bacterium]|nr:protein kinase [Gemmatimonadales bacterium]HRZ08257.1 protein kinase [Gemmatimonadales bacterium]
MDLLTALHDPLAGQYRLVRELGRGGMAIVYLADDLKHGRRVAIKVLQPEVAAAIGGERFLREITVAAGLQHPHILPVHDSGSVTLDNREVLYFVMPFVEGESLRDRLAREGQLPLDDALGLAREVLGALDAAHAQGIVHRDIKPENILLSGGHALVADFGIARAAGAGDATALTEAGRAIGTPAYMSPEQALAERDVDARSDIYSAGCVLYEMLAGEPPFTGRTAQAIISKRMVDPVPSVRRLRDTVPPEVDAALTRALARAPVDRFQTAAEFSGALKRAAGLAATPVPTVAHRRTPWLRPRLAVAFLVVGAALVAAAVYLRTRPEPGASAPRLALTDLEVANRDAETDYLRSGIPDYLVSALRSLPGLEVMPMSMVRRESAITSPVELGRKLRATAVLTGTLARFGGTLAINAELVQVSDGRLLWSGQFEYPDTNYAGLIPAVVTLIADSLRLQLSGGARQDAIARSTVDPVVLDLLLRAGRTWLQGIAGAEGDSARVDSARVLFERVLARDPQNPGAIAGIGYVLNISFIRGWDVPGLTPAEVQAQADSLNRLAMSLDSTLLNSWNMVLINRLYLEDDFEGAREAIERMVSLDPGYAEGYRDRGIYRQELEGDLKGALEDFQLSVTLDPSVQRLNSLAAGLMAARRYPEAAAALQRSIALRESAGARTRLIAAYDKLGWRDQATRLRRHADPSGNSAAPFEAALAAGDTVAYERARRTELRKSADSLIARLSMANVPPGERYNVAELRIGALLCELGDSKQAMDLVDDLYRIRPKRLRWIVTNPDLDCLRQDPRYLPLVKAAGLEQYLRN